MTCLATRRFPLLVSYYKKRSDATHSSSLCVRFLFGLNYLQCKLLRGVWAGREETRSSPLSHAIWTSCACSAIAWRQSSAPRHGFGPGVRVNQVFQRHWRKLLGSCHEALNRADRMWRLGDRTPPLCQWHGRWMAALASECWVVKDKWGGSPPIREAVADVDCGGLRGGTRLFCVWRYITRTDGHVGGVRTETEAREAP